MIRDKYKIGLDLGITSVGFAALATDDEGNECKRIIEAGARMFNLAEDDKGKSLAATRRQKRSMRRGIRRRAHRLQRIKSLIVREGILSKEEMSSCYTRDKYALRDIYEIRLESIDCLIGREDFARLLIHLAQRRGFRSNRKVEDESSDNSERKVLSAISDNELKMKVSGWRTVGEMLMKDAAFSESKRNSAESYRTTVTRALMLDEIEKIFAAQRARGNEFATEGLEKRYTDIYAAQRNFDDGPGEESPYAGNMVEKMVGACTIYPNERRAPSASYSFELFSLWAKLNTMKIVSLLQSRFLTTKERETIAQLFHTNKSGVSYTQIRKLLKLSDNERFNALSYRDYTNAEVEKARLPYMKAHQQLRSSYNKVLGKDRYEDLDVEKRDEIARILTYYKNDERIKEELSKSVHNFSAQEIEAILGMKPFNGFGHLSLSAMQEVTPYLQQGQQYNEACASAGLDFQAKKDLERAKSLPSLPKDQHEINNPVVLRAIHQCIRVINALTRKYGPPVSVHIEVAREVGKNLKERREIKNDQDNNRKANEQSKADLKKHFPEYYTGREPNGGDVIKLRLWKEQNGRCMYTGQSIPYEKLLEIGYCEVDHIIPYSISLDDSYNNKVLTLTASNREKGNRIPLAFITNAHEYRVRVENTVTSFEKKRRLLKENISEEDIKEMKERNLNDTKYISRYMMNYIKDHLCFDHSVDKKKRVIAVNGRVTSRLRGLWGIAKIREDGDLHHARDAIVIACTGDALIKRVTEYEQKKRSYDSEQSKEHFPVPWPRFRHELECRFSSDPRERIANLQLPQYDDVDLDTIRPIFISRREERKATGKMHEETIVGAKKTLHIPRLIALKDISYDASTHSIQNYCPWTNPKGLYEILLERLKEASTLVDAEDKKLKADKKSREIVKRAFNQAVTIDNGKGVSIEISKVSILRDEDHQVLKKVALHKLKYDYMTHSIEHYYNPESDMNLYHLLCDRLRVCYEDAVKLTVLEKDIEKKDKAELNRASIDLLKLEYDSENKILTGCDLDSISSAIYATLEKNMQVYLSTYDYRLISEGESFKKNLKKLQESSFKMTPVKKPSPKGGLSPVVKKIKTYEKVNTGIEINGGIAANGSMVRVDVYHVDQDGFYIVPVYVKDVMAKVTPMKAVVASKAYSEWKEMKKEDFLFSLYPNTLIRLTHKKPFQMKKCQGKGGIMASNCELFYFRTASSSTGSFNLISHDNSYELNNLGIKTLLDIEKFYVDDLGTYHRVAPFKQRK